MDASEARVVRGPGPLESTLIHLHHLGCHTAVCSVARFTRTIKVVDAMSIPDNELLHTALHQVINQHPPLAVTLMNEPSSATFRYIRVPSINLERMTSIYFYPRGSDELGRQRFLNRILEKRLSSRFNDLGTLPPWRVVSLSQHVDRPAGPENYEDIAVFLHPAIADGISAVVFMGTLLAALNSASAMTRWDYPGTIVSTSQSAFPPSLEKISRLPVSYLTLVKAIWRMWFPPSRAGLWTGKPASRSSSNGPVDPSLLVVQIVQTRHAICTFSPEEVAKLLDACHAHRATLTPLLEALIARAFFTVLPADGSADRLKAMCTINLRPFLRGEQKEVMGVYVSADQHEFSRRKHGDIWAETRRAGSSLARVLGDMKRGRHFEVGLLRRKRDMRVYLEGMVGKPRADWFEVSNVGAVDGEFDGGPWIVSRMLFTQSASAVGAAVKFGVATVSGGIATLSASWDDGAVDKTVVDAVLEKLMSSVQDICQGRL